MEDQAQNFIVDDTSDENYIFYTIKIDPNQEPIRIDKYLMSKLSGITRNRLQNAIGDGQIKVNDKIVKSNHKIKPNGTITCTLAKHSDYGFVATPEEMDLNIIYEDDHVMVINKPAGLVVHPGVGNKNGTLVNGLAHYFSGDGNLPVKEGNMSDRPGIVHRIDKDTSGLMVIAKTDDAMSHLGRQFFEHTIERKYQAIVWGEPEPLDGTIDVNIGRDPRDRIAIIAFPDGDDGKHAITHFKTIEPMYYVSVVECQLETGRTHQIRVHMKHLGHSLFNDAKYDGHHIRKGTVHGKYKQFVHNAFKLCPRQALHAKVIGFDHPETGERMRFESELPEDMKAVLEKWRHYVQHKKMS